MTRHSQPGPPRPAGLRYVDYGSELRDSAAVLAFAAADPGNRTRLTAVIDRIAERFARAARTSTQEQAWLLMAAEAAVRAGGGDMTVTIGDGAPTTRGEPAYLRRALGSGGPDQAVTNRGNTPAWRSVSITGVPAADLPAESKGYTVTRYVYRPDGTDADLGKARQTDLFVVVIKGTRTDASQAAQTLVVDLLPAGFEIETATVSKGRSTTDYSWLPELTEATYTEERDDRFVAALDLKSGAKDFTARLCRARGDRRGVHLPRPRRRGHVRARDLRAHRDRQADRRAAVNCSRTSVRSAPPPAGWGPGCRPSVPP